MKELRQQEMDKEYEQEELWQDDEKKEEGQTKIFNNFYFCDEIIDNF